MKTRAKSPTPPSAAKKRRRITCKSCFGSGRIEDDNYAPGDRRCDDCVGLGYYHSKTRPVGDSAKKAKLPKAFVAAAIIRPPYRLGGPGVVKQTAELSLSSSFKEAARFGFQQPVSVHPHATAADARRFAAFWNMSHIDRLKAAAILIHGIRTGRKNNRHFCGNDGDCAEAVLALFASKGAKP